MNQMTLADLAVVYVWLCGLFILAVLVSALGRVAHAWFCQALDGAAEEIK